MRDRLSRSPTNRQSDLPILSLKIPLPFLAPPTRRSSEQIHFRCWHETDMACLIGDVCVEG
jgi:hypothetical protein